jgi:glycosyltransferase involved in cell wall biosynthesis
MTENFVSIITPVYNARKFLSRLFDNVSSQTHQNYEHILVDDGSIDGGYELIQKLSLGDPRVKVIRVEKNIGVVGARNLALKMAKGDFLAFLDADDLWLPNKLSVQLDFMRQNNIAISFTDYRCISQDGQLVGALLKGPAKINWHLHHMTRYIGCLTVMLDRKFVPDFYFDQLDVDYRSEDFYAWSKVIRLHGYASRCPHDLARYSVTENSRSSNGLRAATLVWDLYRNVESISMFQSLIYFSSYIFFVSFKRFFYKPKFKSFDIDGRSWIL